MATPTSFNKNNSAVKRIMQEARELQNDPSTEYSAAPLEDNLFEWHCTLRGTPDTEFEGGLYHFRIVLPAEYPFRPPSLMMLTPSGRFETNTKLCISFTNYHEELWQPAWGVRTAIIGLQGFFPLKGQAAMGVGSLEAPASERRRLAKLSRDWVCPQCKTSNHECLPDPPQPQGDSRESSSSSLSLMNGDPSLTDRGDAPPFISTSGEMADHKSSSAEPAPVSDSVSDASASVGLSRHPVESSDTTGSEGSTGTSRAEGVRVDERQRQRVVPSVEIVSATSTSTSTSGGMPSRPPILLDATISVLLVLVVAILCRKLV